jgi:hypothetical protein
MPKFGKAYEGSNLSPSPDTPAEDISISLEDLDFNVINVKYMTVTRTARNEQTHVELLSLPCYLYKKYKISRYIQAE